MNMKQQYINDVKDIDNAQMETAMIRQLIITIIALSSTVIFAAILSAGKGTGLQSEYYG